MPRICAALPLMVRKKAAHYARGLILVILVLQIVAITGATGGLGSCSVQLALAFGAAKASGRT